METKKIPTLKRDLTEADKSLSLKELGISKSAAERLSWNNINTLGDLLNLDRASLQKIFDDYTVDFIASVVHKKGACLKNEYAELNIGDDIALIPVEELDLSERVLRRFKWNRIMVLGDLLSCSAEDLLEIRGFGQTCLRQVKGCLKLFGYSLKETLPSRMGEGIANATLQEKATIQARIERKEELIAEYNRLIQERKELSAKIEELDSLISTTLGEMKDIDTEEMKRGGSYGGK